VELAPQALGGMRREKRLKSFALPYTKSNALLRDGFSKRQKRISKRL
jgi:hypothetical protein